MKNSRCVWKKAFGLILTLGLVLGLLPASVFAEEGEEPGESDYNKIIGMENNVPSNWYDEADPYGYGLGEDFIMNVQQELLVYRYNGTSAQTIKSYDTLKSKNTDYPLNNPKSTKSYTVAGADTLSYARTVAFDPTGSGRKDHVAVIGLYAKKNRDKDNPAYVYVYVMDKNGHSSGLVNLGVAHWISDKHKTGDDYNNDYMWDFNAMNFLGITAGDYNGDGKESLVVWACASSPLLKQVNVNSNNGSISLSVLGDNGYKAKAKDSDGDAKGLTHALFVDSDDQIVENRLHAAIGTGDFNGDGIDDLAVLSYVDRVTLGQQKKWGYYYIPSYSVSYGVKNSTKSITAGENAVKNIYVQDTWQGSSHVAPLAAGLAVGDIDGDGMDETIISGIYHEVGGSYWYDDGSRKPAGDAYKKVDAGKLVTAIFRGSTQLMFDKGTSTNNWTKGGVSHGGYYVAGGNATSADQSYQQVGVKTVAINGKGKGKAELIFINGDLYSYNASSGRISVIYQPDYFQAADLAMGDGDNYETYIRSMAVGNFDGNDYGYEQIAFVVGSARQGKTGNVVYTMGMIGGIYEDGNGKPSETASSYYCTDNNVIQSNDHYYPSKSSGNCLVNSCLTFDLCAWDIDSDGGHVKYVGKDYVYTDPEVMAIIQAPPYYSELDGVTSGATTSYSITTSYNIEKSSGNSTSFGVGGAFEIDAHVFELSLQAGYVNDWSKTFTKGFETSKTYTFTADTDDKVVIYRTPVTIYTYQLEANGEWSDGNTLNLSFPSMPVYQELTVPEYNAFAEYYNAQCIKQAAEENTRRALAGETLIKAEDIPQLQKIQDNWLGNEGDPLSYMTTTSAQTGRVLLQDTPLTFGVGSGSTSFSYEQSHSSGTEETMAHGFSFDLSMMGGSEEVKVGGYVSLTYMHEHAVSTSTANGCGAECEIGNINASLLENAGIAESTAAQYGFQYQMVTWPSTVMTEVPNEEDLMDPDKKDDEIRMVTAAVPIYGYALSNVKAATKPVTDLKAEFDTSEQEGMVINLSWSNPGTEKNPVGAYALYQIQRDGEVTPITTLPANTTEYVFRDLDGRSEYDFIIRTKKSENATAESVDSNIAHLYLDTRAIYSIELTSSDELQDIYTVYHTDGKQTEIKVRHGVGIDDISLTESSDDGLTDTYTIYFTDGTTDTFSVHNGREIELQTDDKSGMIQWRYKGDAQWKNLVAIKDSALMQGEPGREVELQLDDENDVIQWRYEDEETWKDLIAIQELKGDQGDPGLKIVLRADFENNGMIEWQYEGQEEWWPLIAISDSTLVAGEDGREVVLRLNDEDSVIEWGYVDDEDWYELVSLDQLKGDPGENGVDGKSIDLQYNAATRMVQWCHEGEQDWKDLCPIPEVENGADGRGIVSVTRTSTDGLYDTYTITYTDNTETTFTVTNGMNGEDGQDGKDGKDGKDGATGPMGKQGEKGDTGATGYTGSAGADGRDGADGKDGTDGKNGKDGVGITDASVQNGDLIITLSDGRVINAGHVVTEAQSIQTTGEVKTFYFNTSSSDITRVTIAGKEVTKEFFSTESYGEGTLITISEEVIPPNGGEIKVETTSGMESVRASGSGNGIPAWVIYALIGWNALLTGGVVALAVTRKKVK